MTAYRPGYYNLPGAIIAILLTDNRDKLDSLAKALLEHETLDEDDAYAAAGVERQPDEASGQLSAAARTAAERR